MCGICGFVGGAGTDVLRDMRDVLAHRGPDDAGAFHEQPVALGHRRLSIVDPVAGAQPLFSVDRSVVVVFNGEIYNHPKLKRDFEQRGFEYASSCDTESIVNAYRAYGVDCAQHLDGMFAFVLYDRARKRLFGARDRFGKKPFYYSRPLENGSRSFVFASEIRSLLRHPLVRREATVAETGVQQYLLHDYLPGKHTIFTNIWKLEAGEAFSIDLSAAGDLEPKIWSYWRNAIVDPPSLKVAPLEAAEEMLRLLGQAVERRLMADVPLGVFLSGGLDSSAITALLAQSIPPQDIKTFSIGFAERSFDETPHANLVSQHVGTTHRSRVFTASDCLAELARVAAHMDEPFADPSILPMSMLCRFARETVTVALGGDGGDELLAGYDPIAALGPARAYAAVVPAALHGLLTSALARLLPSSTKNMDWSFRAQRFLRGARSSAPTRLATWMGAVSPEHLQRLVAAAPSAALLQPEADLYTTVRGRGGDEVQAALAYFQRFYLTDDILVKADRASMMHSLEVRAPFLDTALVDFVNRLPSGLKFRFGSRKYLLKLAFARLPRYANLLPKTIIGRAKKGFGIPVAQWIRHDLRAEFEEKLVHDWPTSLPMIERREVQSLLTAHVQGRANHYKELWALFVLGEWARHWAV